MNREEKTEKYKALLHKAFFRRRTPEEIDALYAWVNHGWSVFPLMERTAHITFLPNPDEEVPPKPEFIPDAPCDNSFRGKLLKAMMYARVSPTTFHLAATTTDLDTLIRLSARGYRLPR